MKGVFLLCLLVAVVLSDEPLVVKVKNGSLRGLAVGPNARQFAGIPFAQPPINDLRFRRPVPATDWQGVRDASAFAPDCAQKRTTYIKYHNISEDCLYLNVFAPLKSPEKPLPVMIFFYGGSWEFGGTSFPIYNGDFIENYAGDVVIVTVNYRLGAFGWLASKALAEEDPLHSSGNMGLQDQRMAMQWVKDNIAVFQGDASRVTIWGESAGAGSVSTHLAAPASWGLFHQGIMESGPPANWTTNSFEVVNAHYERIIEKLNCTGSHAEQLTCLRRQSMRTLIENQENSKDQLVSWTPTVDGVELTAEVAVLVRDGKFNKVPVLLGSNRDEGSTFVNLHQKATPEEFKAWVYKTLHLNESWTQKVLDAYPLENFNSPWFAASRLFGDVAMSCPVRRSARWFTQNSRTTAFTYWFTHVPLIVAPDPYLGVGHGFELPFVFNFVPLLLEPAERTLAHHFVDYWTNFANNGDPNVGRPVPVQWPRYSAVTDENINLNLEITTNSHLKSAECDLWDAIWNDQHPS